MKNFFDLNTHNVTVKSEIQKGISIFLSTSYILAVNPAILSQCGMSYDGVFVATIVSTFLATVLMAFWAKLPILVAPGLSINSIFAAVTISRFGGNFSVALIATYLSGIIILGLICSGYFESFSKRIPLCVKCGTLMGIGCAIAILGIESAGLPVKSLSTFDAEKFLSWDMLLTITGVIMIFVMKKFKISGAVLYTMLINFVVRFFITAASNENGLSAGITEILNGYLDTGWNFSEFFDVSFRFPSVSYFKENQRAVIDMLTLALAFTVMHVVDVSATTSSLLVFMNRNKTETTEHVEKKVMAINGIATIAGSMLGTSPLTVYAESIVGIAEGAKTGITALTAAILFLLSFIFAPVFSGMFACVTAPALIYTGITSFRIFSEMTERREKIIAIAMTVYLAFTIGISQAALAGMAALYILNAFKERSLKKAVISICLALAAAAIIFFEHSWCA